MGSAVLCIAAACWAVLQVSDLIALLRKYSTQYTASDVRVYHSTDHRARGVDFDARYAQKEFVQVTPMRGDAIAFQIDSDTTATVRHATHTSITDLKEELPDLMQDDIDTPTPPPDMVNTHRQARAQSHTPVHEQTQQLLSSGEVPTPVVVREVLRSSNTRSKRRDTYQTALSTLCGYCRQQGHDLSDCAKYRLYCGHANGDTSEPIVQTQCVYCEQYGHVWTVCPKFFSDSIICENCSDRGHYKSRCPQLYMLTG